MKNENNQGPNFPIPNGSVRVEGPGNQIMTVGNRTKGQVVDQHWKTIVPLKSE